MNNIELLAPAGNWSCLKTAVENGADAVYFGLKNMNMRDNAGNFEISEMPSVMSYLHENARKGYLALNTIYYNNELDKLKMVISHAKAAGVDAVICWDMAVFSLVKREGIPVHISTQASVSNYQAFKFYSDLGADRIILARECSLSDISEISRLSREDGINCEIEAFVHGAMCVSISGRCFLSAETFGKSANRGRCLQPCRRQYRITDVEEENNEYILGEDYILSPKDLCSIEILPEILDAGVSSLKIEGRIRPPDYVKTTVSCYKKALDAIKSGIFSPSFSAGLKNELSKTYNRGFSEGFYKRVEKDWISRGLCTKESKVYCGEVVNFYKKVNVAEILLRSEGIKTGDRLLFYGKTTPAENCYADEIQINHSSVECAGKGESCGIKIPFTVRPKDKVFKIIK